MVLGGDFWGKACPELCSEFIVFLWFFRKEKLQGLAAPESRLEAPGPEMLVWVSGDASPLPLLLLAPSPTFQHVSSDGISAFSCVVNLGDNTHCQQC